MSTPAPHTPMAFLKGGAAGMFSAACVKALARAGYDPEDFGSYDYVADRIKQARLKTDLYNAARYGETLGFRPDKPRGRREAAGKSLVEWRAENGNAKRPAPTPRDKHLAGSQSGHLTMNSAYQRDRGNPCTSVVDGFEENHAPCMPHHGATSTANSEHHWVYTQECNASGCQARPAETAPGSGWSGVKDPTVGQAPPAAASTYPADEIDADESARIQDMPRLQEENLAPEGGHPRPGTQKTEAGAGPEGPQPGDAEAAAEAGDVDPGAGDTDVPAWQKEITGETAADCIDNFRKAAFSAMKQHCADNASKNEAIANGGDPSKTPQQHQAELQAEVDAAEAAGDESAARTARRRLTRAQNAHCRAEMGNRIGTPDERRDARVPPATTPKAHDENPPVNLTPASHYQS